MHHPRCRRPRARGLGSARLGRLEETTAAGSPVAHGLRNVNDVEGVDFAVKDGTSNTILHAERHATFTIGVGASEASHNRTLKPPTPKATLTNANSGSNAIIAILIG